MIKHTAIILLLLLSLNANAKDTTSLRPHDFAYGMPIITTAEHTLYKVLIPTAVYQGTVHDDLGDIRVFNAAKQTVPIAIRPQSSSQTPIVEKKLTLFPVYGNNNTTADGMSLHVERNAQGAILQVTTSDQTQASQQIIAYLLDASTIKTPIKTLKITLPENNESYIRHINVESSNDLKFWQTAARNAPIANLRDQQNTLEQNEIPIGNSQAKYFKLMWAEDEPTLKITKVMAQLTPTKAPPKHDWLKLVGKPDAKTPYTWLFDTNGHMPVDTIRVKFPEKNTAVQVQLFSRKTEEDDWRLRGQGLVYRLEENGRTRTSPPFKFHPHTDRYWKLNAEDKESKPTLSLGWYPQELIFIAQGESPYTLAYGNQTIKSTNFEANEMIDQLEKEDDDKLEIAQATLGPQEILGGAYLAEEGINWQQWILWTVLGLGTLLLLWMAVRLFKQLGTNKS